MVEFGPKMPVYLSEDCDTISPAQHPQKRRKHTWSRLLDVDKVQHQDRHRMQAVQRMWRISILPRTACGETIVWRKVLMCSHARGSHSKTPTVSSLRVLQIKEETQSGQYHQKPEVYTSIKQIQVDAHNVSIRHQIGTGIYCPGIYAYWCDYQGIA